MRKLILVILLIASVCNLFSLNDPKQELRDLLPEEQWYDVFYLDVLKSKNRNIALDYLPFNRENPRIFFEHLDASQYWYESDYWPADAIVMDEEGFNFFGHLFDTKEVKQIHLGNIFDINISVPDNLQKRNDENDDYSYHNWDLTCSRSSFTFLFLFDGDFLDIFVDDFSKHLATFCRYDDATKQEILHLINHNSYDEENVTWPRRENKIHVVNFPCMVIDSLRLRTDENTASDTLKTMVQGTSVKIITLGKQQTIDGITANWVKVQLDDGTEGWCFGGYLVKVPVEYFKKSVAESRSAVIPFVLIAASAGCVLLLGLGLVIVLKRKKK